MFAARKILLFSSVMALSLTLTSYAYAQQGTIPPAPGMPPQGQPGIPPNQQPVFPPTNTNPEWHSKLEEHTERREFREEAQAIRTEHEDLEQERDRLKSQCIDAKGQDRTSCHEQWEALKQKQETLHERIISLHERMQAERNRDVPPEGADEPGPWRAQHAMSQPGSDPKNGGVSGGNASSGPQHLPQNQSPQNPTASQAN